jgi:hypothetical protein
VALIGPYATEAEAIAACAEFIPGSPCCDGDGESLEAHPDIELVVSGGTYNGTHTLIWDGSSNWLSVPAVVGEDTYYWRLYCTEGVWTLVLYVNDVPVGTETDEPEDCDPLALSFTGATFGAEAPVTAAVA